MSGGGMESVTRPGCHGLPNGGQGGSERCSGYFQMPLHYPRFTRADYETMSESKLDLLLKEYGLSISGDTEHKRQFAIGAFLWPHEY